MRKGTYEKMVDFSPHVLPSRFYRILCFAKWLKARTASGDVGIRGFEKEKEYLIKYRERENFRTYLEMQNKIDANK